MNFFGVKRYLHAQLGEYVSKMEENSQRERNHNFNLYLNFVIFIEKLFKNRKFWLLPSSCNSPGHIEQDGNLEAAERAGFKQLLISLVYKMRGGMKKHL